MRQVVHSALKDGKKLLFTVECSANIRTTSLICYSCFVFIREKLDYYYYPQVHASTIIPSLPVKSN